MFDTLRCVRRWRVSATPVKTLMCLCLAVGIGGMFGYQPAHAGESYEPFRSWVPDFAPADASGFSRLFPLVRKPGPGAPGLPEQRSPFRALDALGRSMIEEGDPEDPSGNSELPSGYTYLGQFIDHDITFDVATQLGRKIRSDTQLENTRTPDLDLDNVYGGGPVGSPHLYNLPYLRVGRRIDDGGAPRFDLFRTPVVRRYGPQGGRPIALIGDPRDDENVVISQLHAAFVAFHNRTADILVRRYLGEDRERYCRGEDCSTQALADNLPGDIKAKIFDDARDHVIHYYHRIVVEDYLPRTIGADRVADMMTRGRDFFYPRGFREGPRRLAEASIPVEFAAAAFRFGHSQVRSSYQLREGVRVCLFGDRRSGSGLQAFEPVTARYLIDWRYFFDIMPEPPRSFNYARRIDPEITPALHRLGAANVVGMGDITSLPARNLARGRGWRLPVGQAVAERVLSAVQQRGVPGAPRADAEGPRGERAWQAFVLGADRRTAHFLDGDGTPLWYYILQEASVFGSRTYLQSLPPRLAREDEGFGRSYRGYRLRVAGPWRGVAPNEGEWSDREGERRGDGGHRLGPVGGTIVGEVLTGLLEHYREKTGKGLGFRPNIIGSTSLFGPLNGAGAPRERYLMRNLLLDAGVARM